MWVLKWKDEIVAKQEGIEFVVLDKVKVPFRIFLGKDTAPLINLFDWMRLRVFPKDRIGADELLKQLGLIEYDSLEIAIVTEARLTGTDWYSVVRVEK